MVVIRPFRPWKNAPQVRDQLEGKKVELAHAEGDLL